MGWKKKIKVWLCDFWFLWGFGSLFIQVFRFSFFHLPFHTLDNFNTHSSKKSKTEKKGFFWMLSLTLHSLLINASSVRYNYNSYFITVFSLHWPICVLDWEQSPFVRCVFILYFYSSFRLLWSSFLSGLEIGSGTCAFPPSGEKSFFNLLVYAF